MTHALVTGAAGFIGSTLTDRLLADGVRVTGVDMFTDYYDPALKRRNLEGALRHPAFHLLELDLGAADLAALPDVDVVFHQAAQPGVRASWGREFAAYTHHNVLATQRLLERYRNVPLERFVYASSSSVYGDAESYPTPESALPRPFSPYGVTKLAGEHLVLLYGRNFGLPVAALRYFTVYGPRQRPDMAFHRFCRAMLQGEPIAVYGDGKQSRDFTFIADAVEANVRAWRRAAPQGVYNIGGGSQVEVIEAVKAKDGPTYILVGGAAGGSKSKIIREIAHTCCLETPGFKVLLLRRTFRELEQTHLRDVETEAPEMGASAVPSAKVVRYPNGSLLQFGHCETAADAANYLSAEYDLICFDELATFEEHPALLIASRARSTKPGVVPKVLAGTNPGGPQSHWVRARFIDKTVDREEYPDYRDEEWHFIPSKLEDNPYLDQNYERKLLALPPELRKAYRDGDWDIFPGQYFPEFRRKTHVVDVAIPSNAVWYRAVDGGFVKPAAILWIAMFDGHAYVRYEWTPTRTLNSDLAKGIKRLTTEFGIGKVRVTVADTSLWTPEKDTGESAAETFQRFGVPLVQAAKDRLNGWKRLREWFALAPDGKPWLMVHPDCTYTARTIPSLVSDDTNPEDVNTDGEDHAADALRYFVMSRPAIGQSGGSKAVQPWSLGWLKQAPVSRGILAR